MSSRPTSRTGFPDMDSEYSTLGWGDGLDPVSEVTHERTETSHGEPSSTRMFVRDVPGTGSPTT